MTIETIIISLSYLGIFILMSGTGFFGIFPPSKIIYILGGYFASLGNLSLTLVIITGSLGHSLGNYIQYEIARQKGLHYLKKFKVFNEKEIKKLTIVFRKKGSWFLFVGKLLDPIKLIICICAGLTKMSRKIFFLIVIITSIIWAMIFSFIGYYFGKSLENFGYIGVIIFILGILVISIFYKYMNSEDVIKEIENE